jgi:hypothetical protein
MFRNVRMWSLALAASLVSMTFVACGDIGVDVNDDHAIRGSGTLTTMRLDLRDFSAVQLSHTFDVDITQSQAFAVSLTVDDNLVDSVVAEVQGDTLVLGVEPGVSVRHATLKGSIAMPAIRQVRLSGASRANLNLPARMAEVGVEASGASAVTGRLVTDRLDVHLSGSSSINVDGSAKEATFDATGASRLELDAFEISTGRVSLSGATSGNVNVTGRLAKAEASGASYLTYRGDPELGDVRESGVSRILPR